MCISPKLSDFLFFFFLFCVLLYFPFFFFCFPIRSCQQKLIRTEYFHTVFACLSGTKGNSIASYSISFSLPIKIELKTDPKEVIPRTDYLFLRDFFVWAIFLCLLKRLFGKNRHSHISFTFPALSITEFSKGYLSASHLPGCW